MQGATQQQLAQQHAVRLREWKLRQAIWLPVGDRQQDVMKSVLVDSLSYVRCDPSLNIAKDVQASCCSLYAGVTCKHLACCWLNVQPAAESGCCTVCASQKPAACSPACHHGLCTLGLCCACIW